MNKKFKYTLIVFTILGLSGCNQRTIVIHPREGAVKPKRVEPIVKSPVIKEEILIKKNPNLGTMIGEDSGSTNLLEENLIQEEQEPAPIKNSVIKRMAFPVSEYNRIRRIGRSTVSGSIYVENSHNSEKIMGKKVKLYLNPVTSYSRQWYQQSYLGGYKMSKSDKRLYNYLKYTVSNTSGKFNFFGVASGRYYLVGTVTCAQECGFSKKRTLRLVREVSVGNGVTKVNLMKHVP